MVALTQGAGRDSKRQELEEKEKAVGVGERRSPVPPPASKIAMLFFGSRGAPLAHSPLSGLPTRGACSRGEISGNDFGLTGGEMRQPARARERMSATEGTRVRQDLLFSYLRGCKEETSARRSLELLNFFFSWKERSLGSDSHFFFLSLSLCPPVFCALSLPLLPPPFSLSGALEVSRGSRALESVSQAASSSRNKV